ncbi:hypothetical protein [Rhizobium sp. AC44/96]|uniref:hypothetical protein n=1 Tax=Rhizobium sp. AC44/96 TaxID=1841654 RepID=UPI001146432F|nr:hypothetical protein [Rhizobium sp. AC44/96]
MTEATKIHRLVSELTGVRLTRVNNVSRRLRESGMLPAGGPGRAPEFDRADAIVLAVATASGALLENVASATRAALATTPGGADVSGGPLTIPRNAEIQLAVLASMSLDGDNLEGLTIEVVHGWPELALIWADGNVQRFQTAGSLTNHQPSSQARIATRIPGSAFAQFIREAVNG